MEDATNILYFAVSVLQVLRNMENLRSADHVEFR